MRRRIQSAFTIVGLLALMLSTQATAALAGPVQRATADLIDASGRDVGFARLQQLPDGRVLVSVHARGLSSGAHGMHVHAVGACAPTFAAAGGHFNPLGQPHGSHAGDLGNIDANPAGRANLVLITKQFTLTPGPLSLFDTDGSALIIHANADDLVTDPTGNSGGRVACGVIEAPDPVPPAASTEHV